MGSATRIAIGCLSMLAAVGLASCGGDGPSSPTEPSAQGPLTPGVYQLRLVSLEATHGCSGGTRQVIGQSGTVVLTLRIQAQGREWIGRLNSPERGDLQLTLGRGANDTVLIGTLRGRAEHFGTPTGTAGSVDVNQPAAVDARLIGTAPLRIFGLVNGQIAYEEPLVGRTTCASATLNLEQTGQI